MQDTQRLIDRMVEQKVIIGPDHFVLGDGFGNPGLHASMFVVADRFYESTDLLEDLVDRIVAQIGDQPVDLILTPDDQSLTTARALAMALAHDREIAPPPTLSLDPVFSTDVQKLSEYSGRVLIHDDVINRGLQIQNVLQQLSAHPGLVPMGLSGLFVRIDQPSLSDVPLFPAIERLLVAFPEEKCPFCLAGRPLNTEYGKGRLLMKLREEAARGEKLL